MVIKRILPFAVILFTLLFLSWWPLLYAEKESGAVTERKSNGALLLGDGPSQTLSFQDFGMNNTFYIFGSAPGDIRLANQNIRKELSASIGGHQWNRAVECGTSFIRKPIFFQFDYKKIPTDCRWLE